MIQQLKYKVFKIALVLKHQKHYDKLLESSKNPNKVQREVLFEILQENAQTEFGSKHNFADINSIETFRSVVPIQEFEDLRPYIDKEKQTGTPALTTEAAVYYNRTSGTTGKPKDIPLSESGLARTKSSTQLAAFVLANQTNLLEGKIFAVGGPAEEDKSPTGIPIGSASGMLYRRQSRFVRSRYVLPAEIFDIADLHDRYVAMAVYGLANAGVTVMATANPSTFVRLHQTINDDLELILNHLQNGTLPENDCLKSAPKKKFRAKKLAKLAASKGSLTYADIWPRLRGVICWQGGSCGYALNSLRKLLPDQCKTYEFGYQSSEFRGSINVDPIANLCLPTLQDNYFEFAKVDEWEDGNPEFLGLEELELEERYYVFVTTRDGLYRYHINDIVQATHRVNATPSIQFVQKGKGVTNITGEKLTEAQVLESMRRLRFILGDDPPFFVVLADEPNSKYLLCMESNAEFDIAEVLSHFDQSLAEQNIEYESKRKSDRLRPPELIRLPEGTGFDYRTRLVEEGQRDSQFKYMYLQYLSETLVPLPEPTD